VENNIRRSAICWAAFALANVVFALSFLLYGIQKGQHPIILAAWAILLVLHTIMAALHARRALR